MKYLKTFENRNYLDEVKNIEYLLTDEGIHAQYYHEKDFIKYCKDGVLKIYMNKNIKRDIHLTMKERNRKYFNDMFSIVESDYFQEYLDRLKEIFDGMDYASISMYINGEIIGVINKNGYFPAKYQDD